MSHPRKRPPCETARLAAIAKRLGMPFPRHMRNADGKVVLWVDARDYLYALQRLSEAWGLHPTGTGQ